MKNCVKKRLSLLLCLFLLLHAAAPVPVHGEDDVPTVTLSSSYLIKSDQAQTVTMYVRLPTSTVCKSFNYTIIESGGITVESATESSFSSKQERYGDITAEDWKADYVDMGAVTYNVPANTSGTLTLGVMDVQMYDGTNCYMKNGSAETTLAIYESAGDVPVKGNAISLDGSTDALVGEDVIYTISVAGESYASAQITLTYDKELLTFDESKSSSSASAADGVVNIVDYGPEKRTPQQYTVAFTAVTNGTAITELTSAAFGTSATAVGEDLTSATITASEVSTVINEATLEVKHPDGSTGTVTFGADYTFKPTFTDTNNYEYTVTATMNGQTVEVTKNDDGTYTIANVTGDLVITVTQTPKQYLITFTSTTVAADLLPAGGSVTYGVDRTFAMPTETGCTLEVTSATIGGVDYDCPKPENGVVTIPGTAIIGDIVIKIERVSAAVTVNGTGATDATYAATAVIGSDYTLTLKKAAGYNYTVTATMNGTHVELTEGDSTYTIKKVTGPIVFTIQKNISTVGANVSEYIELDGESMWLVKIQCDKLTGSVYTYNGTRMFWFDGYKAYCCLVISSSEPEISDTTLAVVSGTAETLAVSCDVNRSGKVDANDAQLVYDLYMGTYTNFNVVSMEKFLLADTDRSGAVETNDVIVVVDEIIKQ